MQSKNRYHGLDFARASLLLLGIFYHVSLIYRSEKSWRVTSEFDLSMLRSFSEFTTDFRMEGFYLISGFFFLFVFSKKRPYFLLERLQRALVPLVFVGFTFNQYLHWASYNYDYTESLYYYLLHGQWLEHLWFLGNLAVYFMAARVVAPIFLNPRTPAKATLIIALVLTPIAAILLQKISITTYYPYPTLFLVTVSDLLYYAPYFLLGMLCYVYRESFFSMLRLRFAVFFLCIYALLTITEVHEDTFGPLAIRLFSGVDDALCTYGMLGILYSLGRREYKHIREVADASYTIYLMSTPLIVFYYINVIEDSRLGPYTQYFTLCALVIITGFFIHKWFVKPSLTLSYLFNGVRIPSNVRDTKIIGR
jgi:glucan biosynthesis protein C